MSNRFPPLAAPAPSVGPARSHVLALLPHWTQSFPMGEVIILAALGTILALA